MADQRLNRQDRRRQLLDTATEIIATEGAAALTLVRLAERARVSRPVAYDHFTTREGLLLALYRDYDEQLSEAMRAARTRAGSLHQVATAVVTAYVDGLLAAGPECAEIKAALSGHPETRHFRHQSEQLYRDELRAAFRPFAPATPPIVTGLFHALDGLATAAAEGRTTRAKAVTAAVTIVLSTLGSADQGGGGSSTRTSATPSSSSGSGRPDSGSTSATTTSFPSRRES
ncbi:TetR/AcrR family transcriptional regulator [Crossiella sp. SN42]|uniref:TetR/AcrR family transcriptional regulator n=1 Tax=Crossiella sp. SN42 TaxID=2944808 RepID=UPI00207C959A|nr:TetR/AcrR family transcriptional regulator [Crossiella sp. SN42]MCO1575940.1 TetR/AcrR family transcriptional regulator [Crossiella sp. SN42]